jgi:plastocyanin
MRRAITALSVALAAGLAPAAGAQEHEHGPETSDEPVGVHVVTTPGRFFSPPHTTALAGDTVTWRNTDLAAHTVSALGGTVFSGTLSRGKSFSHRFDALATVPYLCTIHPFMTGTVEVNAALLSSEHTVVLGGQVAELHGRVPAGSGSVRIEQRPAGTPSFTPASTVAAQADGTFHASAQPATTTAYRAVSSLGPSPELTIEVTARLAVKVTVRRGTRFNRLRVRAPGGEGLRASLQFYSRERFAWREVGRATLSSTGRASFRLRAGLRYHARVVLTDGRDGPLLGTSRRVKLPRR